MDFERQKSVTDEFRRNWERIYRQQEERKKEKQTTYPNGCPILTEERVDG
jgi:hypothetical protein